MPKHVGEGTVLLYTLGMCKFLVFTIKYTIPALLLYVETLKSKP